MGLVRIWEVFFNDLLNRLTGDFFQSFVHDSGPFVRIEIGLIVQTLRILKHYCSRKIGVLRSRPSDGRSAHRMAE